MDNTFTVEYINTIKKNLNISIGSDGNAIFVYDRVGSQDVEKLKKELSILWKNSQSAITLVKDKVESKIQAGLFGLVDDLEFAVKVGFTLGDRVVLIDFLYERILRDITKVNYDLLGSVATSLVNLLHLAEKGRVVMIPNPFHWNEGSKEIIIEAISSGTQITPSLISMLNMLSVTKILQLHPYTIAESDTQYSYILNNQLDEVGIADESTKRCAYDSILGALLSEKILNTSDMKIALDIPISDYHNIIDSNKNFYNEYLKILTDGGPLNTENNLDIIEQKIDNAVNLRNQQFCKIFKNSMTLGGGIIGILGTASVISAPLAITGAVLGFVPTLLDVFKGSNNNNEDAIISVFSKIINY